MTDIERFIEQHERYEPSYSDKKKRKYLRKKGTLEKAWNDCKRGDWLYQFLDTLNAEHRLMVELCCYLVRHTPLADGRVVWDIVPDKSKRAIETNEAWLVGEVAKTVTANVRDDALIAVDAADVKEDAARQWQADYIHCRVPWFVVAHLITLWEKP